MATTPTVIALHFHPVPPPPPPAPSPAMSPDQQAAFAAAMKQASNNAAIGQAGQSVYETALQMGAKADLAAAASLLAQKQVADTLPQGTYTAVPPVLPPSTIHIDTGAGAVSTQPYGTPGTVSAFVGGAIPGLSALHITPSKPLVGAAVGGGLGLLVGKRLGALVGAIGGYFAGKKLQDMGAQTAVAAGAAASTPSAPSSPTAGT